MTFRKPAQKPPAWTATAESLVSDAKKLIEKNRRVLDKLVADVKPEDATFANVCLPQIYEDNDFADESRIIGFYSAVSTSKELRDASVEAEQAMNDYAVEASMREDVFKLVDAVRKRNETLDVESAHYLEKEYKAYIKNGLSLSGADRDRFKAIKKRLSELQLTFQLHLNEETGGLWFTPEELEGLPEDTLSGLKKEDGKLWLTFKYPDLFPTLKYVKNPETRKKVMIANENKCNENMPLFAEAMLLRDEAARLLGYANHATVRIEDKMAEKPETVNEFLGDLRTRLTPGGEKEIARLAALKKADTGDDKYYLWDHRFYDRLLLEKEYAVDQTKIAEYFPLQTTIKGMFEIFEHLFGLVFHEILGKDREELSSQIVWHEDVQVFAVWDEGEGEFVGYLYLDLFPRDGKYGHAANFGIQPGYINREGKRHYPCTALVCNMSKPSAKKPSLLKHDEVVTLFHELGHGIHDLVARTKYSRFHGTSTVEDFVEAPSQMLENWCWTPSQLKKLSRHYSTLSPEYLAAWKESNTGEVPEQLPDELIANLINSKHVNEALFNLRQLHFGIFDMTVHQPESHDAVKEMKFSEIYNKLRHDIALTNGPEALGMGYDWGNGPATFGHLMGGYDAGYYGYLSSLVYAQDMFATSFKTDPMNATEGRRYRHTVLEKGGSQPEMKTLEEFLGRKPSTEAFYKELGLA